MFCILEGEGQKVAVKSALEVAAVVNFRITTSDHTILANIIAEGRRKSLTSRRTISAPESSAHATGMIPGKKDMNISR